VTNGPAKRTSPRSCCHRPRSSRADHRGRATGALAPRTASTTATPSTSTATPSGPSGSRCPSGRRCGSFAMAPGSPG
jgi:hypothetical protein